MADDSRRVLLALNAGSSNVKFSLFDARPRSGCEPICLGSGVIDRQGDTECLSYRSADGQPQPLVTWPLESRSPDGATVLRLMGWLAQHADWQVCAAAHRVVHGGDHAEVAARVDTALMTHMRAMIPMAPLHQPRCLALIDHLASEHPALPQVACFDTAFHHTLDPLERCFGLPRALTAQGLRRYGFHGLSFEYIASVLPRHDERAAQGRTLVAHLGNGASLCALQQGISRGTSMGFSTLEGVLMGTRPGRLDPGIVLYLMRECGMSVDAIEQLLYHQCGLLGVSGGLASDVRELEASPASEARQAIDLFVRSVVREIGTLAAVLGGVDALVFTGGIGEHAVNVRQGIVQGCRWLGVEPAQDEATLSPGCLSSPESPVSAWVIPTDENLMMARHALPLLHRSG